MNTFSLMLPLALRSLVRNRRRSLFTLGAVSVGVGVVIFGTGFGEGLLTMMVEHTVLGRAGAIQVHRRGYLDANEAAPLKLDMELTEQLLTAIRTVPHVTAVAPRIRFGGMVSDGARSSMIMGMALDPASEFEVCPRRRDEVPEGLGSHLSTAAPAAAVLGGELAKGYGVGLGGSLAITASGREGAINALDLEIGGITRGAAPMESKRALTVPLSYGQRLLQMDGRVTELAVAVDDMERIPAVAAQLRARLGDQYEVSTWDEVMPFLRDAVVRLRLVLGGISLVLFMMVVFGIVNTMLMSVFERVREVGTMLAVGLRRTQVLTLFLLEAAVLGMVGGGAGAAVGWSVTAYYQARGIAMSPPGSQFLQVIRPDADPRLAILAVVVAVLGAVLAAAYPARKASRLNPVEALRTL